MSRSFSVSTPVRKILLVESWVEGAVLLFEDREFTTDLILFPFDEFDVILGMDWLKHHGGVVDCKNKTIRFSTPKKEDVVITGTQGGEHHKGRYISTLKAERLI